MQATLSMFSVVSSCSAYLLSPAVRTTVVVIHLVFSVRKKKKKRWCIAISECIMQRSVAVHQNSSHSSHSLTLCSSLVVVLFAEDAT